MKRKIKRAKAQTRVKVEHPFRVIKRQLGYARVRFRGLAKKHCSVGHAIRSFKSVDGAPALADEHGRGVPVMQGMTAERCTRRLKTQKRAGNLAVF